MVILLPKLRARGGSRYSCVLPCAILLLQWHDDVYLQVPLKMQNRPEIYIRQAQESGILCFGVTSTRPVDAISCSSNRKINGGMLLEHRQPGDCVATYLLACLVQLLLHSEP